VIVALPSPAVAEPRVVFPETVKSPVTSVLPFKEMLELLSEIAPATVNVPPTVVLPVEERVVKAPLAGVDAPMAVPLMPVAVTLKLPDVINALLAPELSVNPVSPVADIFPDVEFILNNPVDNVKPLEAVRRPAEVTVPEPVVRMFPEVESVPLSVIVNVGVPADWMERAVPVPAFVSLIMKAEPVPAFVRLKEVAVPALEDSS
jgi:hypothetical protein